MVKEQTELKHYEDESDVPKNHYQFDMICLNCGFKTYDNYDDGIFALRKGTPITNEIIKNSKCPNCNCSGFLRKDFKFNIPNNQNSNVSSSSSNDGDCVLPAVAGFLIGSMLG